MTSLKPRKAPHRSPPESESGVTLPLVALMMVTLLGLAAFAVDLGWFYLNASRIQRAADASALAGVIHMPNDPTEASTLLTRSPRRNGYEDLEIPGTYPTVVRRRAVASPRSSGSPSPIEVPTFFLKVFGMSSQVITRTAQAEFVPPLPFGSPENQFGNSCDPDTVRLRRSTELLGQHPWPLHRHDQRRRLLICLPRHDGVALRSQRANPTFRDDSTRGPAISTGSKPDGASSFTVEFIDIVFRNISGRACPVNTVTTTNPDRRSRLRADWGAPAHCGPTVRVALYPAGYNPA